MDKDSKTMDTTFPTLTDDVRAYATLMGGPPSRKVQANMDIGHIGEEESEES